MKCPNCGYEQPDGSAECASCQIIFEKWRKLHGEPTAQPKPPEKPVQPPFFYGMMTSRSFLRVNDLYRVYVLPGELVFIWAATGGEGEKAIQETLSIMQIFGFLKSTTEEENARRLAVLDRTPLEDLIPDNEYNFRAAREDILEASLEPPSSVLRYIYMQVKQEAVFRFRHREKGKLRLCLMTEEDMRAARNHLRATLGDRLRINV